jgi:hypothetical protein
MNRTNRRYSLFLGSLVIGAACLSSLSTAYGEETTKPEWKEKYGKRHLEILKECVTEKNLPALPPEAQDKIERDQMKTYFEGLNESQKEKLKSCQKEKREQKKATFKKCLKDANLPTPPEVKGPERRDKMKSFLSNLTEDQRNQFKACKKQAFAQ